MTSEISRSMDCQNETCDEDLSLEARLYQVPIRLGLSPVDTGEPSGMLMIWNNLSGFVIEYRSGCCATEHGYFRDIGTIEC